MPKNKKKPVFKWHNHESLDNLKNLWKCLLLFEDIKKIYNDLNQFSKNQNINFFKEYNNNLKSNEFNTDLQNLLDSFNLSPVWEESILLLLLTGYLFPPQKFCEILIKKEGTKLDIYIPIHPETRFEDIKYHWNDIKELKEEVFGKRRIKIPDSFEDYILIYELRKIDNDPYRELIDFGELGIPFNESEEKKAFERFRKGAFKIGKFIEDLKATPINIPKYINEIEKITGFNKDFYNY